jgi:asparagine synthetase B (glutamine-hydrolysing)
MDNLQYRWDEPGFPTSASRFTFSHCTRAPLSWMEELERSAVALAESTTRPIWICSSGGVDSETVCEVFHHAQRRSAHRSICRGALSAGAFFGKQRRTLPLRTRAP